ncbi:MAG: hypothetical protein KC996_10920 [Phycisphaerales bacterium]|nr:hypothetical protein [Phycisphaerales bacterium]
MSRGTQTILSLTTKELRGALVKNGVVVRAESFVFDSSVDWSEAWDDNLRPFDQALRQFVSRVCPKRTGRTTLVYQSPTAVVQFDEFSGHKQQSVLQAEAKIRDSVGLGACVDTQVLSHFAGSKGETTACLTIADQDSTTRKLYAWMTRCGLSPDRMIPTGCVLMEQAIMHSFEQPAETAVCYLGEDSSVIAYVIDGSVRLVRSIEIGYRHINDAYTSAFGAGDQSDEINRMLELNHGAGSLIWEYGVPMNASDEYAGLIRKEIMPRIAPILQRYSVEIKQTFRFGVSEQETPSRLMLCGPGAAIPHIGAALSSNCDLHIDLAPDHETYVPTQAFGEGTIENEFAGSSRTIPSVLPRIAREVRQLKACNKAVVAGLVIALGVMGLEYASVFAKTDQIHTEIAQQSPLVEAILNEQEIRAETIANASVVDEVATLFTENFGTRPHWGNAMQAVSAAMEKSIRIEQIQGDNLDGSATVGLTGLAVGNNGADPTVMLNAFTLALRAQEGIREVQLGATARRETTGGLPAVQFEITLVVVTEPAPFSELTELATAGTEGGKP